MRTVAILGRPNVGKSTLFNRLVGRKLALVDDRPGVTRDRREGEAILHDLEFNIFDTAGLDRAPRGSLEDRMSRQSETAIDSADVVLFVYDARAGVTPIDREFAQTLRRHGKPIILVANKAESRDSRSGIADGHALGFGEPVAISAEHGEGMGDLRDALAPYVLPEDNTDGVEEFSDEADSDNPENEAEFNKPRDPDKPLRLAIIGQPNAGKSTLVNAMLREERMLTGPEAGITRDSVSSDWMWRKQKIKLWDTAGIRRKARVQDKVEKLAVTDAMRAIRFADAVIVLIDASMPIESQDLTLTSLVANEGRALILALSKWDLVEDRHRKMKEVTEKLEDILPEIRGVKLVTLSAKHRQGLDGMMDAVTKAVALWDSRISTGKMNRWLETALERNPPPAPGGRRIKIRYMTQVKSRPPTFALFGNQLDRLPDTYVRYLMNSAREIFKLPGTPMRFLKRGSKNPYEKGR